MVYGVGYYTVYGDRCACMGGEVRDLREDEVGLWYGYVAMAVHGEDFWKGEGQKKVVT